MNHLSLVVDCTPEAIREHLEAMGAPIDEGPVEGFGAQGTGVSFYTREPDGTRVEVRTYRR